MCLGLRVEILDECIHKGVLGKVNRQNRGKLCENKIFEARSFLDSTINFCQLLLHLLESLVDGIPVSLQDHTWHPMISEYLQVQSCRCSFFMLFQSFSSSALFDRSVARKFLPGITCPNHLCRFHCLRGPWTI